MKTLRPAFVPAAALLQLLLAGVLAFAAAQARADMEDLRARYAQLREQLRSNNFDRPLHIDSSQSGKALQGDVYAVLNYPFERVSTALKDPSDWCDILILPFNTRYCHATPGSGATNLSVRIGRKPDQPVEQAYRLDFALQPVAATPDYYESRLTAAQGPVGTRDYRIAISAVPLEAGGTFMHLSYSYGYNLPGRLAMQAYLATAGSGKAGFTVTGRDGNGQPTYIGGLRGAIERTAMRYYLAVDAHLASLGFPREQRLEKRIEAWFDATERYPRQLHEMDRATYVAIKRSDSERQQATIE